MVAVMLPPLSLSSYFSLDSLYYWQSSPNQMAWVWNGNSSIFFHPSMHRPMSITAGVQVACLLHQSRQRQCTFQFRSQPIIFGPDTGGKFGCEGGRSP
jgi:hypothetical protein